MARRPICTLSLPLPRRLPSQRNTAHATANPSCALPFPPPHLIPSHCDAAHAIAGPFSSPDRRRMRNCVFPHPMQRSKVHLQAVHVHTFPSRCNAVGTAAGHAEGCQQLLILVPKMSPVFLPSCTFLLQCSECSCRPCGGLPGPLSILVPEMSNVALPPCSFPNSCLGSPQKEVLEGASTLRCKAHYPTPRV
eukprot:643518-Pelagomonas_calceolata.AAC.1